MCPHHFSVFPKLPKTPTYLSKIILAFPKTISGIQPFLSIFPISPKTAEDLQRFPGRKKIVLARHLFIILQVDILPIASLSWQTQLICCRISRVLWSLYLRFGWLPSLLLRLSRSGGTAQVLWPLFFSIRHITPATRFQRGWIWHVKSIWPPRCWMVLSVFQWFSMMLKMFDCHQALEKWSCV